MIFLFLTPLLNFIIQELKYEENSIKAVQCLNDMVTNALMHAEDCLKYMSALRDLAIFRFCAIPQVLLFCLITSDLTAILLMLLLCSNDITSLSASFMLELLFTWISCYALVEFNQ